MQKNLHIYFRKVVSDAEALVTNLAETEMDSKGVNTQEIRTSTLKQLKTLLEMSLTLAKTDDLKPKARQDWGRLAAYTAQVMVGLMQGLDEKAIDAELLELERLMHEVQAKAKAGKLTEEVADVKPAEDTA